MFARAISNGFPPWLNGNRLETRLWSNERVARTRLTPQALPLPQRFALEDLKSPIEDPGGVGCIGRRGDCSSALRKRQRPVQGDPSSFFRCTSTRLGLTR